VKFTTLKSCIVATGNIVHRMMSLLALIYGEKLFGEVTWLTDAHCILWFVICVICIFDFFLTIIFSL